MKGVNLLVGAMACVGIALILLALQLLARDVVGQQMQQVSTMLRTAP